MVTLGSIYKSTVEAQVVAEGGQVLELTVHGDELFETCYREGIPRTRAIGFFGPCDGRKCSSVRQRRHPRPQAGFGVSQWVTRPFLWFAAAALSDLRCRPPRWSRIEPVAGPLSADGGAPAPV